MNKNVLLVTLNEEQIQLSKKANGERKQITHAVVCGTYGQLFGTEKQCKKYYWAWKQIFPYLFDGGIEVDDLEINSYESTPDLVLVLIKANDTLKKSAREKLSSPPISNDRNTARDDLNSKKGFFSKLFGF